LFLAFGENELFAHNFFEVITVLLGLDVIKLFFVKIDQYIGFFLFLVGRNIIFFDFLRLRLGVYDESILIALVSLFFFISLRFEPLFLFELLIECVGTGCIKFVLVNCNLVNKINR
jgi:hypothetical protein